MFVPMVAVRHVGVAVAQPDMAMQMAVRLASRIARFVLMPMVQIVLMPVAVRHRLMVMPMEMMLGQVEPYA